MVLGSDAEARRPWWGEIFPWRVFVFNNILKLFDFSCIPEFQNKAAVVILLSSFEKLPNPNREVVKSQNLFLQDKQVFGKERRSKN